VTTKSLFAHQFIIMDTQAFINEISTATLGEDENRFFGILCPHEPQDPTQIYSIKCHMISGGDKDMSAVEVRYSLLDFKFKGGQSIQDIVNWKIVIKALQKPCLFDAKCDKLGDNEYSLTNVRTVYL
jgi:hypothetical protein